MTIKDITSYIEEIAPLQYAEDFDNVGLLVGDETTKVTGVLVTLDCLEATVNEAITKRCNLIVSFHPIIFNGLKKLNGKNYVDKTVIKAIQNNISIYATHTALDNSFYGVSAKMTSVLGLKNQHILLPKKGILKQLTTYVPTANATQLKQALFDANAGNIGNYSNCSFTIDGLGTFKGNELSNPTIGQKKELHTEPESKISVLFESKNEQLIIAALLKNHPYEEVAYEIITTDNMYQKVGMGMIGEFEKELSEDEFINVLKQKMKASCIKHSAFLGKKIKKIAVLGGSGGFAIDAAKKANVDAYVSADFKYHDFFKAENKLVLVDIGHYESEQFTKNLITDYLSKKFTNFAVVLSENNTNPIFYK